MKTLEDYECDLTAMISSGKDDPGLNEGACEVWDDTLTVAEISYQGSPPTDNILLGGPTREEYAKLFAESYRMLKIIKTIYDWKMYSDDEYNDIYEILQKLDLIA